MIPHVINTVGDYNSTKVTPYELHSPTLICNESRDKMGIAPWYSRWEELHERVQELKERYDARCKELQVSSEQALSEVWRDLITRIVQESNWQEGIYLELGRTRELVDSIFDNPETISGPHLDFKGLCQTHRRQVLHLKQRGASVEELAALNLSRAHRTLQWIAHELAFRQSATLVHALKGFEPHIPALSERMPPKVLKGLRRGFKAIKELEESQSPAYGPLNVIVATEGELLKELEETPFEELLHPMRVTYIHLLHRLTMMGIFPPRKLGNFRKNPVNVGDPDVLFPPPIAVPQLMEEYCREFPTILPSTTKYDPIMQAAKVSYRFVRVHPYSDGNGRVSRLLMNLILWGHHPPVSLKADKKGRHRYHVALKRANRGNIKPMACLIALGVIDVYDKLLDALGNRRQ